jgi:hypothetical protein
MILSISAPFWQVEKWTHSWRHRVCLIEGLTCIQGQTHYNGSTPTAIVVDATIAPIVLRLNELGHTTQFSCSGLKEDHDDPRWGHFDGTHWAYLAFDQCDPTLAPRGVVVQDTHHVHWTFSRQLTHLRTQWEELAARLGVELL